MYDLRGRSKIKRETTHVIVRWTRVRDAASAHRVEAHRHGDPQKRALVQSLLQAKHVPHDLALPTPLYSLVGVHLLDAATRTRLAPTARFPEGTLARRRGHVLQVELQDVVESTTS